MMNENADNDQITEVIKHKVILIPGIGRGFKDIGTKQEISEILRVPKDNLMFFDYQYDDEEDVSKKSKTFIEKLITPLLPNTIADYIGDVAEALLPSLSKSLWNKAVQRLVGIIELLTFKGYEISIVAHSNGTVMALDALQLLEERRVERKINHPITKQHMTTQYLNPVSSIKTIYFLGSPLWIYTSRLIFKPLKKRSFKSLSPMYNTELCFVNGTFDPVCAFGKRMPNIFHHKASVRVIPHQGHNPKGYYSELGYMKKEHEARLIKLTEYAHKLITYKQDQEEFKKSQSEAASSPDASTSVDSN